MILANTGEWLLPVIFWFGVPVISIVISIVSFILEKPIPPFGEGKGR